MEEGKRKEDGGMSFILGFKEKYIAIISEVKTFLGEIWKKKNESWNCKKKRVWT